METRNYKYRGYKIQVTHTPPFWQAAVYPIEPRLPKIDWTLEPIRAVNVRGQKHWRKVELTKH